LPHDVASFSRGVDRNVELLGDVCGIVGVIEVTMPDEDRLGMKVDEVLHDERRPTRSRLGIEDEGVEKNNSSQDGCRNGRARAPGKDHFVLFDCAGIRVYIFGAEERPACGDECTAGPVLGFSRAGRPCWPYRA
jgi:hypothetical protein